MTTSEELYVWTWLPGHTEPVLAGRVDREGAGPELFRRIAMNIAISNNDDRARNHAAFWDGRHLELTPAYDLAPGQRSGDSFAQAMAYGRGDPGAKVSNFAALVGESETYGLSASQGRAIIDQLVASIDDNWDDAAEVSRLSAADRTQLRSRQILPRAAFFGYEATPL
ncbi:MULTISPECIES: HipA domain-containing protein [unclassified Microbacterium]|uniref:HipA domain-containing protein n=1 Tax=unclassified Microbacterium TaxID=2609290 RepID=UPI00301921F4